MKKIFVILACGLVMSCSQHSKNLTTDSGTLAEGDRLRENGFYEEARKQYFRIKTEFPQSPLQVQTDLRIAESYYEEESFQTAVSAYQDFIKTYPGRPEIPEALFKLGMCYANQMPNTPQRDTRSTAKVIDTFTRLVVDYPESTHSVVAQEWIEKARDQLAQKTFEIGRFYERMKQYDSAARRFAEVFDQYSGHSLAEEALAREIKNLRQSGQGDKAEALVSKFEERFPNSRFQSMIKP